MDTIDFVLIAGVIGLVAYFAYTRLIRPRATTPTRGPSTRVGRPDDDPRPN